MTKDQAWPQIHSKNTPTNPFQKPQWKIWASGPISRERAWKKCRMLKSRASETFLASGYSQIIVLTPKIWIFCQGTSLHTFHACINASMYQCINASVHQCIHASMHPCINASMLRGINADALMHASMHQGIHASMRPCVHASMRPCIHP